MTSPFLETFVRLLSKRGLTITRFEFGYMAARRTDGKRRPPPRAEKLLMEFYDVFAEFCARETPGSTLLIGGKSMGGRIASMTADQLFADGRVHGLLCLGYPFHPPQKPEKLRVAHLETLSCPTLIVQGERDPFGRRDEVDSYKLSKVINLQWCPHGDHDFKPGARTGFSENDNMDMAADAAAAFAYNLDDRRKKS